MKNPKKRKKKKGYILVFVDIYNEVINSATWLVVFKFIYNFLK